MVTQAVYGLGGVGKSELALHHATACRGDYPLIWWITAEDAAQIEAGLAALAGPAVPPDRHHRHHRPRRPSGRSAGCRPIRAGC